MECHNCCEKLEECHAILNNLRNEMEKSNFSRNDINVVMLDNILKEISKLIKKICK